MVSTGNTNFSKAGQFYWWLLGPLVAFLTFLPGLSIYFIGEDFVFLHFASSGEPFYKASQNLFYRPLPNLLWQFDFLTWKLDATGYHFTNLVLHVLNTLLVGLLIFQLTRSRRYSALTAVLFAAHPIHAEPVIWLSGRPDLLGTFFFLLALLSWLGFSESNNKLYYYISLLTYACSLFSKEVGIGLPIILFFLAFFVTKKYNTTSKLKVITQLVPYLALAIVYLIVRYLVLGSFGGYPSEGRELFNIIWNLTFGIWLPLLFPFNIESVGWPPILILAAGLLFLYISLALQFKKFIQDFKKKLLSLILAILIIYITILPALIAAPVAANLAQSRILYLPSAGFCLLLAILINQLFPITKSNLEDNLEPTVASKSAFRFSLTRRQLLAGFGLIYCLGLLIAFLPWWQAGQMVRATFDNLAVKKSQIQPGDTIYYEGVPDSWKGAYVWRNGLNEATRILLHSQVTGFRRTPDLLVDYRNSEKGRIWFIGYNFNSEQFKIAPNFSYNVSTNISGTQQSNYTKKWNFVDCQIPTWSWGAEQGNVGCQTNRGLLFDNLGYKTNFTLQSPFFSLPEAPSSLEITAYTYYDFQQSYIPSEILLVDITGRVLFEQNFDIAADGKNHRYNLDLPSGFSLEKPVRAIISIKNIRNSILWETISLNPR